MADGDFTCTYEDLHTLTHHKVNGNTLYSPYPENHDVIYFGMGCFWCPEQLFWETEGVFVTSVGYMGGHLTNPTYEDVCEGGSGHTEAVKVVYDASKLSIDEVFQLFIANHNPFRRVRRDENGEAEEIVGKEQYKSAVWCSTEKQFVKFKYLLSEWVPGRMSKSEIEKDEFVMATECVYPAPVFYPAEDRHQQYMAGRKKRNKKATCIK